MVSEYEKDKACKRAMQYGMLWGFLIAVFIDLLIVIAWLAKHQ